MSSPAVEAVEVVEVAEYPQHLAATQPISVYAKSVAHVAGVILAALAACYTDGKLSGQEVVQVAVAGIGALVVYAVPNAPTGVARYAKTGASFLTAALMALAPLLTPGHHLTTTDLAAALIVGLTSIGVGIVPNAPPVTHTSRHRA